MYYTLFESEWWHPSGLQCGLVAGVLNGIDQCSDETGNERHQIGLGAMGRYLVHNGASHDDSLGV
jgi:hypothetical protein